MNKNGINKDGSQRWYCADAQRARDITYLRTEKGNANRTKNWAKFHERIVKFSVWGYTMYHHVPPEHKQEFLERLISFRAQLKQDYLEVNKVWLDQLDSPAK